MEEASPPVRVRAFFGLPVPEAHRAALAQYLAACATAAPRFRWTPADPQYRWLGMNAAGLDVEIAATVACIDGTQEAFYDAG